VCTQQEYYKMRILLVFVSFLAASYAFVIPHNSLGKQKIPSCRYLSEEDIPTDSEEKTVSPQVKCPKCDKCDGSGRILGGIAVVLPWWPIKAYRPCPDFIDRGGKYTRIGQPLDEIAFGRDSSYDRNNF